MADGKTYHVALREDGKWQVKAAKAEKALKIFAKIGRASCRERV